MNGMDTSGFIETILRTDDEDAVPNDVAERRTSNGNSREEIATTVNSIGKSILNGSLPLTNRPLSNIMNGHSNQVNGKRTRGNSICDVIVLSSSDEDELGKNDSVVASKRNKIENTVLAKGGGGGGGSGNSVSVGVIESGIKKIVSTPRAVQTNGFPSDSPPITQTTKDLMTQQQQRQWLQQPQQTVPVNVPSCSLEPEVVLTVEGKAINRPLPHALSPNGTRPLLVTSSATTNTSSSPSSLLTASGSPLKKIKLIVKKSGVPNKANAATCAATAAAHQLAIASKSLSTIVDDQVRMTSVTPTKITHIQTTVTPSIATVDDYSYPLPPTSQKRTTMRKTGKKQDSKSTKDEDIEVLSVSSSDDESERIEKAKNETKDDWRSTVFEISDDDDDDNDDNDNITNATKKTPSREKVNLFEKENKNIFLMCDKQFHSLKIKMKTNWMVLSDSNFFLEKKGFYNKMSEFSDLKFSHLFHWVLSKRLFYIKDTFRMPKYFILKNSIFDLAKSPKVILELVSHWVLQTEASIITKKLNVDMEFLRGFYQTLRAVCTLSLTYKKFATKKDVVEKTFRYFLLSNTVSNATSAVTNANIANQIGNCNLRTLKSILECWFEKTCVIFMDDRLNRSLLKGYNVFSELKNPSKNYNIKHSLERRLLLLFQGKIHSLESSLIQQFLDELAWRDEFGRSYDDLLKSIIECIQFQTKKYANKNFILFINSVAKNPQEFLIEPNFNVTDKHPKQKESDQNSYIHIKCTESRAEKLSAQTIHGELLHQQQLHPQTADMRLLSSTRTTSAAAAAAAAAAATAKNRNNAAPVTRSSQRASSTSSTNSSSSVSTTASRTMPSRAVNNKCDNEQKKLQSVRHLLLKKKTLQPLLTRSATLNSVENAKCMEKAFFGYKFGRRSEIFSKSDQLYNCAKCKRSFSDNIKFLDHLNASIFNSHNETELNLCRYCLHRFNNAKDLKRHIDTKHPLTILGSEDCFSCPICETVYSTMLEIRSHLNDSHPPYELPYKCHVCSFMCYSHRLAVDHFYFEHKGFGLIQCPLCLYCVSFRRENVFNNFKSEIESYTSHIRKHLTSKPFKCNKCVLIFNSLEEVSKHNEEGHAEAQKDVVQFNNFQNWVIQNLLCFECNDSLFLNMGHLKVPSKCEKCNYSTNCRKAFSFHSCKKAKRLQLDEEMVCLCGFKSNDGFELAKHLVQCEHKTVYGSASEADFILSGGQYLVSLGLERK